MKPGNGMSSTVQGEKTGVNRRVQRKQAEKAQDGGGATLSVEERRALIAESAWLRAQARGFAPGGEVEDWLAAEAEVDQRLLQR